MWVEHPIYSQVMYCLDRVPVIADRHPELKLLPPFSTMLSGNQEEIAKLSKLDLEVIAVTTLTDMTVDQFTAEVKGWLFFELPLPFLLPSIDEVIE